MDSSVKFINEIEWPPIRYGCIIELEINNNVRSALLLYSQQNENEECSDIYGNLLLKRDEELEV